MKTWANFDEAVAAAAETEMVCGTLDKETNDVVYFLMPRGVDDDAVAEQAFQVREGRPRSEYERWLMDQAKALKANA